ncbi:MAG: hypothetical protein JNL28_01065 [Planctomycetes bacterium]|nr:hypothetical protein [Planctomycetota bacterium]
MLNSLAPFVIAAALAPQKDRTTDAAAIGPQPVALRAAAPLVVQTSALGARRTILMTGYWPPSNEAVRPFSANPAQNPGGWIGQDWEGRGYDVYAYFPEFSPPTCTSCGTGSGDFEVDYQDTSNDFWPIVNALQPIAIITFSRTNASLSWEVEQNQYNNATWTNDYVAPFQPTPAPPDASVPAGTLRLSKLPMAEIVSNVTEANLGLNSFICVSQSAGQFVSGFMAYHGVWYQSLHDNPTDPAWCIAAGHIHVGPAIPWATARKAAEVTLRTVIHYVDSVRDPACQNVDLYCPTSTHSAGPGALLTTTGSTSIAANNLRLIATGTPPGTIGQFFYGSGSSQVAWGNGLLCVPAPFARLLPLNFANANGLVDRALDFTQVPLSGSIYAVQPGSTWNFQFAFRDALGGGANFNSTNAVRIVFCP